MLLHLAIVILVIFIYATVLFLIVNWLEYERLKKEKSNPRLTEEPRYHQHHLSH